MQVLLETLRQVGAYAAGGRERVGILGVLGFEAFEFFHHHVEIAVGDFRRVQHIVVMVVAVEFVAQGAYPLLDVGHGYSR